MKLPMKLKEDLRRQYLEAMGITPWERRSSVTSVPLAGSVATSTAITESVSSQSLRTAAPAELPAARDTGEPDMEIAGMDWDTLALTVSGCQRCDLHKSRTQTVFGVGPRTTTWLFVGEAPGAEEDRLGEPFVGPAGQLLNAMLFALALKREDVYIANVLKCRPPNNRDPLPQEATCCEPFLLRQIELLQPRVIVALGRHAAHSLLRSDQALSKLRSQPHTYHGIPLVVTYHPAYLLRTPGDKRKTWEDLCRARTIVLAAT